MFDNKYPYTDFHELNLDWFMGEFKKLVAEWEETKGEWNTLHDYVQNYFENLNVQTEIDNKINVMIADGTFADIVSPFVTATLPALVAGQLPDVVAAQISAVVAAQLPAVAAAAAAEEVGTWLATHIDPDTGYVIDDTLSVTDAAADAKTVGDSLVNLRKSLDELLTGKPYQETVITPTLTTNAAISISDGTVVTGLTNVFACTEDYIDIEGVTNIVYSFFGYGIYGFAFYDNTYTYISGNKNIMPLTSDDIPANAKYIRFTDHVAGGTHPAKTVTLTITNTYAIGVQNMIDSSINKRGLRFAHMSFDDCVFWDDLTQNEDVYTSCFDNAFLASLKSIHDDYGVKFTCLCFNEHNSASIADVTDHFASEFATNKDWLKFGFHGTNVSETFDNKDPAVVVSYYNTFVNAIYQMTGDYDCIDRVTRLSSFSGSSSVCVALRDCDAGIRGLLCNDTNNRSYYLSSADYGYINKHCKFFDITNQLTFIHSMRRMEANDMTLASLDTITQQNHLPIYEFFSHQDQFSSGVEAKFRQICEYLVNHDFTFEFSEIALCI